MRDIVFCRECTHRVPPMRPNERSYCDKHKIYLYEHNDEGYCIHGERKGESRIKKQIAWALDVLNNGAWWDDIDDDASAADMNSLYDAIGTVNNTLERLTFCSECKYFKQRDSMFGYCGRYNCCKLVFDFCSVGEVEEKKDEKTPKR